MLSDAAQKIADHNARVHAANAPPDDPAVGWTLDTLHAFAQTFKGGDVSEMGDGDDPAVAARIAADALLRETTAERDALRAENEDRLSTVTDLLCNHADLLREVGGSLNDIAETERAVEWLCAFRRGEG